MDLEKFRNDVYEMTEKLSKNLKENDVPKLHYVRQQLIDLYKKNLVKINHSILELICANNLISHGYAVEVVTLLLKLKLGLPPLNMQWTLLITMLQE